MSKSSGEWQLRRGSEKRSLAVVIFGESSSTEPELLIVRRPPDDEELPDIWGLPAVSLSADESWEDAVRRLGREKLGVVLEPVAELQGGESARADYLLRMRLYEAIILEGQPQVPRPHSGVTQYVQWMWSGWEALIDGARSGSLCCQLCLLHLNRTWV